MTGGYVCEMKPWEAAQLFDRKILFFCDPEQCPVCGMTCVYFCKERIGEPLMASCCGITSQDMKKCRDVRPGDCVALERSPKFMGSRRLWWRDR